MKKVFVAAGLAFAMSLGAVEFAVDAVHSKIEFKTKHLLVTNVGGDFKDFDGKLDIDLGKKKINSLEGQIIINSVNTGNQERDHHLRSASFFDAEKNPKGYLKMTRQEGDKLYGILTLNGISKEVIFNLALSDVVIHPQTKSEVMAVELEGKVNRKDFKIGMDTPNAVVGDEVKISINLELNKK